MLALFKGFIPLGVYIVGLIFFFLSLTGQVRWTFLLLVGLLPLRNVIERLQPFPMGKDFNDLLIFGMLVGWLLSSAARRTKLIEKSPLNAISVVLIFYTFFTLIKGYFYLNYYDFFNFLDPRVQDWKNYCLFPILFFLTLNNIRDKKWIWRVMIVMGLAMFFMNTYVTRQISWFSGIVSRDKIDGTFVYLGPNEIAAFYNQFTVLLLCVYFALKRCITKNVLLLLIFINLYCVVFLFSRAAYLGLVVGLFFLFAIRKPALLVPLFCVVIFWQVLLPPEVKARIEMTTNQFGELDPSAQNRIIVWEQSMNLFKSEPILGVGFGVFRFLGFGLKDTHNIYLKIMAEQGVVGLVIFLALLNALFKEGWKLYKRGDDEFSRAVGLGFSLCIVTLAVNNMFGDRWTYLEMNAYLWIFAGIVARLNILSEKPYQEKVKAAQEMRTKKIYGKPH